MISVYIQVSSSAIYWETIINLKKCNEAILSKFQERRKAKFRKQLVNIKNLNKSIPMKTKLLNVSHWHRPERVDTTGAGIGM